MKIVKTIVIIIIAAAVLVGGALFIQNWLTPNSAPVSETLDIQGTIQDIGELATAEYSFTITNTAKKDNLEVAGIKVPFTQATVLYSYEGIVKAGIQFSRVEITQNETQKKIYVRMPSAEILSTELDNSSLVIYDEKYSALNTFTFEDMNIAIDDAKNAARASAIEKGLLERADENAKSILRSTIGALVDLNEYEIVFY